MKKLLYLSILLATACTRSADPGPGNVDLAVLDKNWSSCRTIYSAPQTQANLVGKWRLVANGCGECNWSGLRKTNDDSQLVFTDAQRVKLYRQGQLIAESGITLTQSQYGSVYIGASTQTIRTVIRGPVEFCQNVVAFRGDYTDGSSYYFVRSNN